MTGFQKSSRSQSVLCFVADIRSKKRDKVLNPSPRKDPKGDSGSKADSSAESG